MGFFGSSKDQVNKTYNQTELQRLEVIVPPLDEQRTIAAYLSRETTRLDALIGKAQELDMDDVRKQIAEQESQTQEA